MITGIELNLCSIVFGAGNGKLYLLRDNREEASCTFCFMSVWSRLYEQFEQLRPEVSIRITRSVESTAYEFGLATTFDDAKYRDANGVRHAAK